jgi:hypothetical protein
MVCKIMRMQIPLKKHTRLKQHVGYHQVNGYAFVPHYFVASDSQAMNHLPLVDERGL